MGERQLHIRYPEGDQFRRVSLTLPPDLVANLDTLAEGMCVTRSSLVTCLLREHVADLADLLVEFDGFQYDVTTDDVRRFRGQSETVVVRRLRQLEQLLDDQQAGTSA